MRAPGDRRDRVRFEVFGPFWGTFKVGEPLRVLNLTSSGALVESDQPLAVESIQSLCLMIEGQPTISEARVRHVRPAPGQPTRYLVGLEFTTTSVPFLEAVDRLVANRSSAESA